jgi:LPS-assembly lipoprotein
MHRSCSRLLSVLALVALVAGCGFQLRGSTTLPDRFNPVFVEPGEMSPEQLVTLKGLLRRASARMANAGDDGTRLYVSYSASPPRRLVQSSPGAIELYRLDMQLQYRLLDHSGNELVPPTRLEQSTDVELDTANVLANEQRIVSAREVLEKGLIRSMIFDLNRR